MKQENSAKYFLIVALLCIGIISILAINLINQKEETVLVNKPNYNIKEVSYKATVGKPEEVLMQGALQENTEKVSNELTVYNQNLALVKDIRKINLKKGVNIIEFKDTPAQIDPTSVIFKDLTYPDTEIIEQKYEYDLVNSSKLLEKYIDKQITVQVNEGQTTKEYTGKLLAGSNFGALVMETKDGIITLNTYSKITYPELPNGLITKPTLVWKAYTEKEGERNTETIYLTSGLNWRVDYIAVANNEDTKLDFAGWATIDNKSGTSYPDTTLKLVAGEINKIEQTTKDMYPKMYTSESKMGTTSPFVNEKFFEYYLYTLDKKTDIGNNETKQISLLNSNNVNVKKEFVYEPSKNYYYYNYYNNNSDKKQVEVKLIMKNTKSEGLGIPLPKGIVRVYKKDSTGKLQFIGEDEINHTKTEDEIELSIGNAFDVTGERIQENVEETRNLIRRESYRITLENQKDQEITVKVKERAYNLNWTIIKTSMPFEKKSSTEFYYYVKVPAKGKAEITYTIEYKNY
jgi:hypothetical protein